MNRLLYDKETKKLTGIDREAGAFEGAIEGIDASTLTKQVTDTRRVEKADEEGNALYLLPQEPLEVEKDGFEDVETTEETDRPVMLTVAHKVPLLDEDGKQVEYEVFEEQVTPAVLDEEGEVIEEEVREMVPTGVFHKCFTFEEEEVQKTDEEGNALYWTSEHHSEAVQVEQAPLEITEADERFSDELERASEEIPFTRTIRFEDEAERFTFEDAIRHKEAHLVDGTLYAAGTHFEGFTEELFATHLQDAGADIGFEAFYLPPGKEIRTAKLDLPEASQRVHIRTEPKTGLQIEAGATADDMRPADARGEVLFDAPAESVYVSFRNGSERPAGIRAFSLLI